MGWLGKRRVSRFFSVGRLDKYIFAVGIGGLDTVRKAIQISTK